MGDRPTVGQSVEEGEASSPLGYCCETPKIEMGEPVWMIPPAHAKFRRKLKLKDPTVWDHHRGGWGYVVNELVSQLCAPDGILFVSEVGMIAYRKVPILEEWVGVVHQTPINNYPGFPGMKRMLENESFKASLKTCRGLFTLCSYLKEFLQEHLPDIPVCTVPYPCAPFAEKDQFSMQRFAANADKKVLFIGEFMRRFQAIYDLQAPPSLRKVLIKAHDVEFDNLYDTDLNPLKLIVNDSVDVWMEQASNEEYDKLLSENVVFLSMFDAGGCTTVVECAARGTPLVINRLPAHEEFLGKDYPLFYDTLDEAAMLLASEEQLARGSRYLLHTESIRKSIDGRYFLERMVNSAIFRQLALPPSQASDPAQTKFPQFRASLILAVQGSDDWLGDTLEQISLHPDHALLQVIVWFNGEEASARAKAIFDRYSKGEEPLHLEAISSTSTYQVANVQRAMKEFTHSNAVIFVDSESAMTKDTPLLNGPMKADYYLNAGKLVHVDSLPPAVDEKRYDVCLVMCQWKRVKLLPNLLERLARQKFDGSFQLLIWNNNIETQKEVATICEPFVERLNLRLIQSTRNYYCSIRFAAKDLIQSDLMLIIDDDIIPNEGYIQRFVDKYREYGPRAVICCRGHVFKHHVPSQESPHKVWEEWDEFSEDSKQDALLQFYSEKDPDCKVHFIHADNLLIPRLLLREALSSYSMPDKEFILVDDYFLSFVLSHYMDVDIWRVKADDVMEMSESGDDHKIALYHNSDVRETRVDCYLYHLSKGWPKSRPLRANL